MTQTDLPTSASGRDKKLWLGIGGAAAVAAVALVVFILPAEYGIDPTGAGKALGVMKLSETEGENIYLARGNKRQGVLTPLGASAQPNEAGLQQAIAARGLSLPAGARIQSDRFEFELLPFEGIEMKYELAQGTPMVFAWRTTAPVNFDMHAHPYQGGEELTESYVITDAPSQNALYVAPFTGIHGWYWQNQTLDPVTLTVDATGAITKSFTFDQAGQHPRELTLSATSGGPSPAP